MNRRIIMLCLCTAALGCKTESAPKPRVDKPPARPTQTKVDAGSSPDVLTTVKPAWSSKPPQSGGEPFHFERVGNSLRIYRDDVEFQLPVPTFGECVETLAFDDPNALELTNDRLGPVWFALRSKHEAASLRLGTRGATLVINDGCLRAADVTASLLASSPDATSTFAAAGLAPSSATDDTAFTVEPSGEGATVLRDRAPFIAVTGPVSNATVAAYRLGDDRWVRLSASTELPSADGESAVGREQVLVWSVRADGVPKLLLDHDVRYGAEGADREESRVAVTRTGTAGFVFEGTRVEVIDAANVGAGRCPEMEGALVFRHHRENATWSFRDKRKWRATRDTTSASGCLDEASAEVRKRRTLLADKVDATPHSWEPISAP